MSVKPPEPHHPQAEFVQRPWPQRSPESSPFRHLRGLVLGAIPGRNLPQELTSAGLPSEAPRPGETAWESLQRGPFDLLLLGPGLRPGELPEAPPQGSVVLTLGADGTPWSAAAYANLAESVDALGILQTFGRAQERGVLLAENEALRARLSQANPLDSFHSSDPRMQAVLETARAIANTRATVLLLGESGTGKSRLARCLHATSDRRSGPFQVVHCGALPSALLESELFGHAKGAFTGAIRDRAGRFEEADGGTIFLDEIQSAPLELQVKLLRVLQDREFERVGETRTRQVDVRILAASNQDLLAAI
ncbi:MAG TPA: sigma-54 factor interaction domain-containing protein, partial [Planctomycetota bacterium]|nr:sigma-54 factor interaction domain-containing protein [Planctomycetota bacterium]